MKSFFGKLLSKTFLTIYKRTLALVLAFIMLFNLSSDVFAAAANSLSNNKNIDQETQELREVLSSMVVAEKAPGDYLKEVLETIETAIEEAEKGKNTNNSEDEEFKKITKHDFIEKYNKELTTQYNKNVKSIETQLEKSFTDFDEAVQKGISSIEKSYVKKLDDKENLLYWNKGNNKNLSLEGGMFRYQATQSLVEKLKNARRIVEEGLLKSNPYDVGPKKLQVENAEIEWDEDTKFYIDEILKIKEQEEKAKTKYQERVKEEREKYEEEISTWKTDALKQLKEEYDKNIQKGSSQYDKYSKEYDELSSEVNAEELSIYKNLVHNVVENFKKINASDKEAESNFISILTYLSSMKEGNLNRNKFIVGDDRTFIMKYLEANLSKASCSTYEKVDYDFSDSYSKGYSSNMLGGGGSASAGKIYDVQTAKVKGTKVLMSDEKGCNISISSLIPYGNLDGDGFVISGFLEKHWEYGTFGTILPIAVKAMTLTEKESNFKSPNPLYFETPTTGRLALSLFIDNAIKKENQARKKQTEGFWNALAKITLGGITYAISYDDTYCRHNVCSSAEGGFENGQLLQNAWEVVADIIADKGWIDLLEEQIMECKLDGYNTECGGIYPFLFGALLHYPKLLENYNARMALLQSYNSNASGTSGNKAGTIFSKEIQSKLNTMEAIRKDFENGGSKLGLIMYAVLTPIFKGENTVDNKMRKYNLVAKSPYKSKLDPFNRIYAYDKNSSTYKTEKTKENAKLALAPVADYLDIMIAIVAVKDLIRLAGTLFVKMGTLAKFFKVLVSFRKIPMSFSKSVKLTNALKAKGITATTITKYNKFRKFVKSPIKTGKSAIIARLGTESSAMIGSVSGKITGVAADEVAMGSEVVFRPVSKGYRSPYTYRETSLGGLYSTHESNVVLAAAKSAMQTQLSFGQLVKNFWMSINPFAQAAKRKVQIEENNELWARYQEAFKKIEGIDKLTPENVLPFAEFLDAKREVLERAIKILEETKELKSGRTLAKAEETERKLKALRADFKNIDNFLMEIIDLPGTEIERELALIERYNLEMEAFFNSKDYAKYESLLRERNSLVHYEIVKDGETYTFIKQYDPKDAKRIEELERQMTRFENKANKKAPVVSNETQAFLDLQTEAEISFKNIEQVEKDLAKAFDVDANKPKTGGYAEKVKQKRKGENPVNSYKNPTESDATAELNREFGSTGNRGNNPPSNGGSGFGSNGSSGGASWTSRPRTWATSLSGGYRSSRPGVLNTFLEDSRRWGFINNLRIRFALSDGAYAFSQTARGMGRLFITPRYYPGFTAGLFTSVEAPVLTARTVIESIEVGTDMARMSSVGGMSRTFGTSQGILKPSSFKPFNFSNSFLKPSSFEFLGYNGVKTVEASKIVAAAFPMEANKLLTNFNGFEGYDPRWYNLALSRKKQKPVLHMDRVWWNKETFAAYNADMQTMKNKVITQYIQEAQNLILKGMPLPAEANITQQKIYAEVQKNLNTNSLLWIYGNSVEEVLSVFDKKKINIAPPAVAAMFIFPVPFAKDIIRLLTASPAGTYLSDKQRDSVRKAITKAFSEAAEKYVAAYESAQSKINDISIVQDEKFVEILQESIIKNIQALGLADKYLETSLITQINKRIAKMKDGELMAVREAVLAANKQTMLSYVGKYGQEALDKIADGTCLDDSKFVKIFMSYLQKELGVRVLSPEKQINYIKFFEKQFGYENKELGAESTSNIENVSEGLLVNIDSQNQILIQRVMDDFAVNAFTQSLKEQEEINALTEKVDSISRELFNQGENNTFKPAMTKAQERTLMTRKVLGLSEDASFALFLHNFEEELSLAGFEQGKITEILQISKQIGKEMLIGDFIANGIETLKKEYGIVTSVPNSTEGVKPLTKEDFWALDSIVTGKPFYEDDKFIIFHTPKQDGTVLVTMFAKLRDGTAMMISMRYGYEISAFDTFLQVGVKMQNGTNLPNVFNGVGESKGPFNYVWPGKGQDINILLVENSISGASNTVSNLSNQQVKQYLELAEEAQEADKLEDALGYYDLALSLIKNNDAIYASRASVKVQLGYYESAVADYTEAIKLQPKNAVYYFDRAKVYISLGWEARATEDYMRGLKLDPANINRENSVFNNIRANLKENSAENLYKSAVALISDEEYAAAIDKLNEALKISPNNEKYQKLLAKAKGKVTGEEYYNRALENIKYKKYEKAVQNFKEAIKADPTNAKYCYELARLIEYSPSGVNKHRVVGKYKQAENMNKYYNDVLYYYNQAIELDPKNSKYYYDRANFKKTNKDFEGAQQDFETAKEIEAEQAGISNTDTQIGEAVAPISVEETLEDSEIAAVLERNHTKENVAARNIEHAKLVKKQKQVDSYLQKIEELISQKKYDQALGYYNMLIELDPTNDVYHYKRGVFKTIYLRNRTEGIKDFDKAIELAPEKATYYYERGLLKGLSEGGYMEALADYNQAIELDPTNPIYYEARAQLKYWHFDKLEALEDLKRALKYSTDNELASAMLKDKIKYLSEDLGIVEDKKVVTFKEKMNNIFKILFTKKSPSKLYMAVSPTLTAFYIITQKVAQGVEYLLNQTGAKKQAFNNAVAKTAKAIEEMSLSEVEAQQLFIKNLKEELIALNVKEENINVFVSAVEADLNLALSTAMNQRVSADVMPQEMSSLISEIEQIKANPKPWTEQTAVKYLIDKKINEDTAVAIVNRCKMNKVFSPYIFDLFLKGYEIRPDVSFNETAFDDCFVNNNLDIEKYVRIYTIAKRLPHALYSHIADYSDASIMQINALFNVVDNYPEAKPLQLMTLACNNEYGFKASKFNIDKYNKTLYFLNQGMSFEVARQLIKACYIQVDGPGTSKYVFDENLFATINRLADEAIKRKATFLTVENKQFSDEDIRNFIYLLAPRISATLKIADEGTILAAMDLKMLKFENFLEAAAHLKSNLKYTQEIEAFLEAFYPGKSQKAQKMQSEITNLKQQFGTTDGAALEELKQKINTTTRNLRNFLEQATLLSPQEKIERIEVMSNFSTQFELDKLIKLATTREVDENGVSLWNKAVSELIANALGGVYNQKLEDAFHLTTNPYLTKLLISIEREDFRLQFQELANLIVRGELGANLDRLQHNVVTQEKFAKLGLNYERWTHPDSKLIRTFYDGDNLVEIRQVNMRDVAKSLFLGNDSHACTAMGGFYDTYAIPYIMNTLVGAIEVVVNGKVVGNTMVMPIINRLPVFKDGELVVGSVTKEVALLVDDLKMVEPYNSNRYLQEVVAFAEDLAREIGVPQDRVYLSDSNTKGYNKLDLGVISKFNLVGNTLDPIWLNTLHRGAKGSNLEYDGTIVSSRAPGISANPGRVSTLNNIEKDVDGSAEGEFAIDALNNMIDQLNDYIKVNTFSVKRMNYLQSLTQEIYKLSKDPAKVTVKELEDLMERINIFTAEKPLFVFKGYGFEKLKAPKQISKENFFDFDLSKEKDPKAVFEEKIKMLSDMFDEYTIYTLIHGYQGYIHVAKNSKLQLVDLLDIVEQNRNGSTVNFISGSCQSSSAFKTERQGFNVISGQHLNRPGINLLLMSGVNDISYLNDMQYLRVNDMPSVYLDLVKNRRYGTFMFYNGNVYNSVSIASEKTGDTELSGELNILSHALLDKDGMGLGAFLLLKWYSERWKSPSFSLIELEKFNKPPFPFSLKDNNYQYRSFLLPPLNAKESWKYKVEGYDASGAQKLRIEIPLIEQNDGLYNEVVNITERNLQETIPGWQYEALPEANVNSATKPLSPEHTVPANQRPVFDLTQPRPQSTTTHVSEENEIGFYDETLEFNLLDAAARPSANAVINTSKAAELYKNLDFNSREDMEKFARIFVEETGRIKSLMSLEERGNNLSSVEKAVLATNEQIAISLRKSLSDIVFALENNNNFPKDLFNKMANALADVDVGVRIYFRDRQSPAPVEVSGKKYSIYQPSPSEQDRMFTDISALNIIVMNDEPDVASYIADNLKTYSANVYEVHTIYELKQTLDMLREKGIKIHYFFNDMNLGHTISASDSMRLVKQAFPEIAQYIGFIMWSDSSHLGDYLSANNYIGHVKRVEGETGSSLVKEPAFYLSYIESQENLLGKINGISLNQTENAVRVFKDEDWNNLSAKTLKEILEKFGFAAQSEVVLFNMNKIRDKAAIEKLTAEAEKYGITIKMTNKLEDIKTMAAENSQLFIMGFLSKEIKAELFNLKGNNTFIAVTSEELSTFQKQNYFADGYSGYYYVEKTPSNNSNSSNPGSVNKPNIFPKNFRRGFGVYLPIITVSVPNPDAPKFTEQWASFETMTPAEALKTLNGIDTKNLLVKDKYGKLPIEYALKNKNVSGFIKQNDVFTYLYMYSAREGLTPNTVIDENKGLTLAMLTLIEEQSAFPFGFLRREVDYSLVDKEGHSILKYILEGAEPEEVISDLMYSLDEEEIKTLVNMRDNRGEGALQYLDRANIDPETKIKIIRLFRKSGFIFDTSNENLLSSLTTRELRDYTAQALKETKEEETFAAYVKKAEGEFENPSETQAILSKEGRKISMAPLTYVEETVAARIIAQAKDINEINGEGMTALMYAAKNPNTKIVEMVLKAGGRANIQTQAGRALLIAEEANNTAVVTILQKKDKVYKNEQKAKNAKAKEALGFDENKNAFLNRNNLLPTRKALKGLYVSFENSTDLIEPLINIENLRYVTTEKEVQVKEEKLLASVYDSVQKNPFEGTPNKVMAILQGNNKLYILNRGIALKEASTGKLAVDIVPDTRRQYGIVRIIHNHIQGASPITKADFMLLPSIVRSNPFFEDDKFIVFHTPKQDGTILITVFAKVNKDEAIIISMKNSLDTTGGGSVSIWGKSTQSENKAVPVSNVTPALNQTSVSQPTAENLYESPISRFLPNSMFNIPEGLLRRDINKFASMASRLARTEVKTKPSEDPIRNTDRAYFSPEDFYGESTFTGEYSIENPQDYTVMVVQDNHHIFEREVASLKSKGFNVLSAKDGEDALSILNTSRNIGNKIHFILLDGFISYTNGYEIAEKIVKENFDTIIIGTFRETDNLKYYKKGFDFFLNAVDNDMLNSGDFISYLIQKYGFIGTPQLVNTSSLMSYDPLEGRIIEEFLEVNTIEANLSGVNQEKINRPIIADIDIFLPKRNRDRVVFNENAFPLNKPFSFKHEINNPQDYTVMIVQNNKETFEQASKALSDKGFKVIKVNNNNQALDILETFRKEGTPLHFVFLDTSTGYDVAKYVFKKDLDTVVIGLSEETELSPKDMYERGFDFAFGTSANNINKVGTFLSYLIYAYSFKGGKAAENSNKILTFENSTPLQQDINLQNPQNYGIAVVNNYASKRVLQGLREYGFTAVEHPYTQVSDIKFQFENNKRNLNIVIVDSKDTKIEDSANIATLKKEKGIFVVRVDYETADLNKLGAYISKLIQVKELEDVPFVNNTDWTAFDKEDVYSNLNTKFEGEYSVENPQNYNVLVAFKKGEHSKDIANILRNKGFNVITANSATQVINLLDEYNEKGETIHFAFFGNLSSFSANNFTIQDKIKRDNLNTITLAVKEKDFVPGVFELNLTDKEKFGNFLSYLIKKYGFNGNIKKPSLGQAETLYLSPNSSQDLAAPIELVQQTEETGFTTEIREEPNSILFSDTPADTPASLATFLAFLPFVVSHRIRPVAMKQNKKRKIRKNIPLYFTDDIKSHREVPLNLNIQVSPDLKMPNKYDKIIFDANGVAYFSGENGTKVISHFYMEVPNNKEELKLLVRAVKQVKLASPFEFRFIIPGFETSKVQRVSVYDGYHRVLNINALLPEGFLKDIEGVMFSNGKFYTFDKKTLKKIREIDSFVLGIPKKQIPALIEIFANSTSRPTIYFNPTVDKASVVYRDAMITNISLGKTFGPITKKELNVNESVANGIMFGIQYIVPLLSTLIKPLVNKLGEKKTLVVALSLSVAAGVMSCLAGFYGVTPSVDRATWQKVIFLIAFGCMSISTLLRQLVSNILIRDNSGVVQESDPKASKADKQDMASFKRGNESFFSYVKRVNKQLFGAPRNVYSIPHELVLSRAFVFKSLGTLAFLTFPFLINQAVYYATLGNVSLNLDYSVSFPILAVFSAYAIIKTLNTNLKDRTSTPSKEERQQSRQERKDLRKEKREQFWQNAKEYGLFNLISKNLQDKRLSYKAKIKLKKELAKEKLTRKNIKDFYGENSKLMRYFASLTFANAHEIVISSALASQLSTVFQNSATSNFYVALGLYAPLLLGRWLFSIVRGKASRPSSFAAFTGLSLAGTLLMFLNPTSTPMLLLGAAVASLGMGNGFTLLYSHIIEQYSKAKEMTISTLSSLSVVPGAVLAMLSPYLIDHGHFHGSLLYALVLVSTLIVFSLPVMEGSVLVSKIKKLLGFSSEATPEDATGNVKPDNENPNAKPKENPLEDIGKWWHTPKNGPDMNNPTPQN